MLGQQRRQRLEGVALLLCLGNELFEQPDGRRSITAAVVQEDDMPTAIEAGNCYLLSRISFPVECVDILIYFQITELLRL